MITKTLDIEGPVRIVDFGGDGPLILLLHGLAGSAENWAAVGAGLAASGRTVAVDLLGCGDTPPAGRAVNIDHNAALVTRVSSELGDGPATLIGHSMGGLVAMRAAVDHPEFVDRLVLVSPALPLDLRELPDAEVFLKLLGPIIPLIGPAGVALYRAGRTPRQEVDETLRMNCFDIDTVPSAVRETIIDDAARRRHQRWAVRSLVDSDRSIASYVLRPSRIRDVIHRVTQPVLLVHGTEDRLVSTRSARWAAKERPDWDFLELNGIGHIPMLETPEAFVGLVRKWLDAP
jgi:pimeloyl-ACP methyl ester carboxylesterase